MAVPGAACDYTHLLCLCWSSFSFYEQKMKLLDKVVNVFYPLKEHYKLSGGSFLLFIKILSYLVGCFYQIFLCFMLTLELSLKSEGTPPNKG